MLKYKVPLPSLVKALRFSNKLEIVLWVPALLIVRAKPVSPLTVAPLILISPPSEVRLVSALKFTVLL